MTKISTVLARAFPSGPAQVELPAQSGNPFAVNPAFVMSVEQLTPTTTEINVAGKGAIIIDLAFVDVLLALGS